MHSAHKCTSSFLIPQAAIHFLPGGRHCFRGIANVTLNLLNATTITVLDPCIEFVMRGRSMSAFQGWTTQKLIDRFGRPIHRPTLTDNGGFKPNELKAVCTLALPIMERAGVWTIGSAICKSLSNMPALPIAFTISARSIASRREYIRVNAAEIENAIHETRRLLTSADSNASIRKPGCNRQQGSGI